MPRGGRCRSDRGLAVTDKPTGTRGALLAEIVEQVRNTSMSRFAAEEMASRPNGHTCRCKNHPRPDLDAVIALFGDLVVDRLKTWALLGDLDEEESGR